MDFQTHKVLADNALKKAREMFEEDNQENYRTMLHFAHVARLHYEFSSMDKDDEEYLQNIKTADEFLLDVYQRLGLEDSYNFIKNTR